MREWIVGIALIVPLLAGCGSTNKENGDAGPIRGVSSKEAEALGAERNPFEASDDPPFSAETRFAAGRLAESQGAFPQAIAQYNEAIKLEPEYQPAWYQLGVLYTRTKQFPKAVEAWQKYVKLTDGAPVAYSNLGFCYEVWGDRAKAEDAYRKGITKDPRNAPCRVNYGLMLARMGREADALEQLQAVLTPAEAHYNLGSVYQQLGKKEEARAQYQKALDLNPQFWEAQTRMTQIK